MSGWRFLATRFCANRRNQIAIRKACAASRADDRVFQVRADVRKLHRSIGRLLLFDSPLLDRTIDRAQVTNAGIFLSRRPRPDKIRNSDRSQQTNQKHRDHNLDQGEPAPVLSLMCHGLTIRVKFFYPRKNHDRCTYFFNPSLGR